MSKSKLHAYKLSHQSTPPELVSVQNSDEDMTELSENHPTEIKKQNYICCLYDNHAWIGLVEDVSEEHGDFFIKFVQPHGPSKLFFWPNTDDTCRVHEDPPSYFSGLILMTLVGCMRTLQVIFLA